MINGIRRYFRRLKYGPPVIVVSGLPRSGTSMMMKMLDAAGLEIGTDNIRTADEDNPKGYFELEKVKDLDKEGDKNWLGRYRGRVVKIISFLLQDLPGNLDYRVIFMQRNLEEVIASQNKMLVRRGETPEEEKNEKMLANYKMHLRKISIFLEEYPNYETLMVDYRKVIEHPAEEAGRVSRFMGKKLDTGRMAQAVDGSLYRNRR